MKNWYLLLLLSGCGGSTFEATEPDAGTDAGEAATDTMPDVLGDSPALDSTPEAEAGAETAPEAEAPCPTGPGPTMVRVPGGYCIDSTEVTRSDYATFLSANVDVAGQPAECAWNTSYVPASDWTGDRGEYPVTYVDWCDARGYCEWAGKRLCGRIGGGPNRFDDYADASKSEWYAACSAGGTRTYPYGSTYDGEKCNGLDHTGEGPLPAGASGCEGGYPGIFDLSGNVWEWEDSCNTNYCKVRGGSFGYSKEFLNCGGAEDSRPTSNDSVGFRCCT